MTASDMRRLFLLDDAAAWKWLGNHINRPEPVPGREPFSRDEEKRLTSILYDDRGRMKQRFTRVVFCFSR